MVGPIICGVDDSESAKRAARVARGLSSKLGLRLVFLSVVEDGASEPKIGATAERLERMSRGATEADCGAGWLVDIGDPADRLVDAAAAEKASLIVVGSTGPRSCLLGSISAEVSRRAPCPVVVVPPGSADLSSANGRRDGRSATTQLSGGIARLGLGSSKDADSDFAGGIARFDMRSGRH
jgi:nucleotide-binding universal stress UspA family protein